MEWWQVQELLITIAIIVGVLVPVFGLTWRFALRPTLQSRARLDDGAPVRLQNERIDHMERQLEEMESLVRRLVEATEFDRQLKSGNPPDGNG